MSTDSYLSNHFLVAMPALADPNFSQTVTLICEHNERGALGIVVNRPSELTLADIFAQLSLASEDPGLGQQTVFHGGPVQTDRGFVLHDGDAWESSLEISPSLRVTTSRDILTALARGEGPANWLVALGYAGWGAGQLEQEMVANAWLSVPAEAGIIFSTPVDQRYRAAAALLGVDLSQLSNSAGHA